MDLKIVCPNENARDAKVFLDGKNISRWLRAVEIRVAVGEMNEAVLTLKPARIEVDAGVRDVKFVCVQPAYDGDAP